MKVAIICFGTTGKGGMETVMTQVIKGLNTRRVETKLFLLGGSIDEAWLGEGVNHTKIGAVRESRITRYLKYATLLPYHLLRFGPDIIVGADERAVYVGAILKRLLRLHARLGSWIHFSLTTIDYPKLNSADFHIAISEGVRKQFCDLGLAKMPSVHLVHNPVVISPKLIPRPDSDVHFLYVGRLMFHGEKRTSDLLRALANVKGEWTLSVVGDGDDSQRLQELAAQLGIHSRINWLGWKAQPWNEIREASALVLTSESEGFGMVLVEAMSYGIPCISSDCPTGPSEIVANGENGWLYAPQDLGHLTVLLQAIVENPKILPPSSSVRGSIAKFESGAVMDQLVDAFSHELQKASK